MSWSPEVKPYFTFHPHVQLVRGVVGAALHDLFSSQVYWIREPQVALACSLVGFGKSLPEAEQEAGLPEDRLSMYVLAFARMGLGAFADHRTAVEPFRPKLLWSQAETRSAYRDGGTLTVEIADRCPYACRWCTARTAFTPDACACGVWADQDGRLPIERLIRAIDELHLAGVHRLVIRGGEPFLHPEHLWELVAIASRREMICEVHSTGNRIDAEAARRLRGRHVHMVLLAAADTKEQFERAVGLPGSFDAFVNATKVLANAGVPFSVKVPVSLADPDEGQRTAEWARGLGAIRVMPILHSCDCGNPTDALTTAAGARSPRAFAIDVDGFYSNGDSQYCLDNAYFIAADGRMTPCIGWRERLADLKETEMETVLRQEVLGALSRTSRRHLPACRGCEFRLGCRACLVRTIQRRGSAEARHWTCRYEPETATWRG